MTKTWLITGCSEGGIGVLVNNAGYCYRSSVEDLSANPASAFYLPM